MAVSTKLRRIAELARPASGCPSPEMAFTSLAYLMDIDWLLEAYRRTRKDGAVGIDGVTAAKQTMNIKGGWILEVDIRKFFDHLSHEHLRDFLQHRVRDGVLKKLIHKWPGTDRRLVGRRDGRR